MTNGLYILFWRWHTCVHQSSPIRKGISCLVVVLSLTGYDLVPKVTTCFHHFSPLLHFIALMIFIWMFYDFLFCLSFTDLFRLRFRPHPYDLQNLGTPPSWFHLKIDGVSRRKTMLWNMKFCNLVAVVKETFPKTLLIVMIFQEGRENLVISDQLLRSAQKFGEATTWISWDIAQLVSLGGARHKLMGLTSKHVEIVNHFNHLRYQNLNQWII